MTHTRGKGMSYIVKNCKSNYKLNGKYVCGAPRIHHYFCQNCTDCLIKRVIDKCYEELGIKYNDIEQGRNDLANELFDMFKIEEITNDRRNNN